MNGKYKKASDEKQFAEAFILDVKPYLYLLIILSAANFPAAIAEGRPPGPHIHCPARKTLSNPFTISLLPETGFACFEVRKPIYAPR